MTWLAGRLNELSERGIEQSLNGARLELYLVRWYIGAMVFWCIHYCSVLLLRKLVMQYLYTKNIWYIGFLVLWCLGAEGHCSCM